MKLIENADIVRLRGDLVDGMTDYMIGCAMHSESGAGYTQESIERCDAILDAFLTSLEDEIEAGNPEKILNVVKDAVMAVNVLNDECGGGMIETDQREQLCDIIIFAANEAGLITDEDITLAWREW